jgi:membrane protease YdiL (CAAX protease family)
MDGSSDADPESMTPSRFEGLERAVHRVDDSPPGSPGGGGWSAATSDESLFRTFGAAAALSLGGIAILAGVTLAVGLVGALAGLAVGTVLVVSVALGQYLGFIGLGTLYLRVRGLDWQEIRSYLGFGVPSVREVGVIVSGYLVIVVATVVGLLLVAFRLVPEPAENEGAAVFASNPELIPTGIVVMFLVVGLCEEFLFRGIVQNRLRERLSAVPAVVVAGLLFASVHLVSVVSAGPGLGDPAAIATAIVLLVPPGLVLGAVYEYTGNLVVPWLLHSVHNSVLLGLLYVAEVTGAGNAVLAAAPALT